MSLLSRLFNRKTALESTLKSVPAHEPTPIETRPDERTHALAALIAQANERFQAGDRDAARQLYIQALETDPGHARSFYMLSGIAVHDGDAGSAVGLIQRAIALEPAVAEFHFSLAGIYLSIEQPGKALACFREALRLKPDSLDYQRAAAGAFMAANRFDEGIEAYRAIVRAAPRDGRAYFELGKALQLRGDLKQAEEAFAQAVTLSPDSEGAHLHLAVVLRDQGRPVEAEAPARRAVTIAPDMYQGWFVLGGVLGQQGRHTEAVEQYRKILALDPHDDAAWSGVLLSMNYSEQFSARAIFEEHVKYGNLFPKPPPAVIDATRLRPGRRLRVGYLSADFWQHPVAQFIAPILSHHDRSRFEVFCYHTGQRQDTMTARLRSAVEHWQWLPSAPDEDLERILRNDGLDILIELSGHTGEQRLKVLAKRVAPVQASYLGYPNTTGLAAIDYRITDARADPPGESDRVHVEKLVRLPGSFLCYGPPAISTEPPAAPVHRNPHVTFASFNNFAKISGITVELWSRILARVPRSKLTIKARGLQDSGLRTLLLNRFSQHGIEAERIQTLQPIAGRLEHLRSYADVDIGLDPFPYHGTTTTMEALSMGVPVVTLEGDRHAARVGASILCELGLSDLVARTADEYVNIAARLADDPARLDAVRQSLRGRLSQSTLTDGARFTAGLEQAYLRMWEETLVRSGRAA